VNPVGLYRAEKQEGIARAVTDRATFAYLAEVFIWESHRGRGLSNQLMRAVMSRAELRSLRCWHLATRDAHGLYRQFGFSELKDASRHMEIYVSSTYKPH
jgi:GNAT superfamily N-acetyltransferase